MNHNNIFITSIERGTNKILLGVIDKETHPIITNTIMEDNSIKSIIDIPLILIGYIKEQDIIDFVLNNSIVDTSKYLSTRLDLINCIDFNDKNFKHRIKLNSSFINFSFIGENKKLLEKYLKENEIDIIENNISFKEEQDYSCSVFM